MITKDGSPLRVLLCDDHRLFIDALGAVLEGHGCEIIGRPGTVGEAVKLAALTQPDLCMIDVNFPGESGLDGIEPLLSAAPDTRVVMLSGVSDRDLMARALAAGASGYADKADDVDCILDIVRRVVAGELVMRGPSRTKVAPKPPRRAPIHQLTPRELAVLECLVKGLTVSTLAAELSVTYATARSHVQNVLMKLGVHSQLEAVAFATTHGIVSRPEAAWAD